MTESIVYTPSPSTSSTSAVKACLVRVEDVKRVYRVNSQEVHALRGVDLSVERAKLVLLRGPSGSGKTSLLFDRGYKANDKVKCTNVGGGKLRIARLPPGKPLSAEITLHNYLERDKKPK